MDEERTMQQEVQENQQGAENAEDTSNENQEITLEALLAENARLKAESAKNKAALDKSLHDKGELTKQLRAKMTAQEQAEAARQEQEEERAKRFKELEDYKRKSEAKDRYINIGMPADLAKEAAEAEVSGDMEALTSVYKRHQDVVLKQSEAEWLKRRPEPAAGHGEDRDEEDPFLAGFKN